MTVRKHFDAKIMLEGNLSAQGIDPFNNYLLVHRVQQQNFLDLLETFSPVFTFNTCSNRKMIFSHIRHRILCPVNGDQSTDKVFRVLL